VEFEFEAFEILQREIAARHGFRLEGHHHQLVGRCAECQKLEEADGAPPDGAGPRDGPAPGAIAGPEGEAK
jgi:Fur family transcriptional regulator, ferric uptake regulator